MADAKARKESKEKEKKLKADGASAGKKDKAAGAGAGSARGKVEKEEFMAALKKRSEARFWDNDDALLGNSEGGAADADDDSEDDNDGNDGTSSGDDRSSQEDASGSDIDEEVRQEGTAESSPSSKDTRKTGAVSDMDWLRSKVDKGGGDGGGKAKAVEDSSGSESEHKEVEEGSEDSADASEGESEKGGTPAKGNASGREAGGSTKQAGRHAASESDYEADRDGDEEESGLSVGRLFVRNLPYTCTEDDLRELFGSFGMLSEVHLPVDDVKRVRFGICPGDVNVPFRSRGVLRQATFVLQEPSRLLPDECFDCSSRCRVWPCRCLHVGDILLAHRDTALTFVRVGCLRL